MTIENGSLVHQSKSMYKIFQLLHKHSSPLLLFLKKTVFIYVICQIFARYLLLEFARSFRSFIYIIYFIYIHLYHLLDIYCQNLLDIYLNIFVRMFSKLISSGMDSSDCWLYCYCSWIVCLCTHARTHVHTHVYVF